MTVFNMYIFDRKGNCLYYTEWNRRKKPDISQDEECKLVYGMLFSIKKFTEKLSPTVSRDGFYYYKTDMYKLNYFETPSGLKFVLNTDPKVDDMRDILSQIYGNIYVEHVVKNPLCKLDETITSELFMTKLDTFIRSLKEF